MTKFIIFFTIYQKKFVLLQIIFTMQTLMNETSRMTPTTRALLDRARRYCALSEQCETSVRQKLISWGAVAADVEPIIRSLRADDYLNDSRYACAYAESKILHQHWGRQKVLYQLRLKHLSKEAIAASMKVVDDDTYYGILREEAEKKLRVLGSDQAPDYYRRLYSFLSSRGYTLSEINHVITNNPEQ